MTEGPAETSPRDGYLPLTELARYSGLSVRTLRGYITAKRNPLPHYRPGAKVLVRRSEFDAWMHAFRSRANGEDQTQRIDRLIDEVCTELARSIDGKDAGGGECAIRPRARER